MRASQPRRARVRAAFFAAEARPEATALVFKGTRLTYRELEEASNRLARALKKAGCRRGDRVGLLMPKSLPR